MDSGLFSRSGQGKYQICHGCSKLPIASSGVLWLSHCCTPEWRGASGREVGAVARLVWCKRVARIGSAGVLAPHQPRHRLVPPRMQLRWLKVTCHGTDPVRLLLKHLQINETIKNIQGEHYSLLSLHALWSVF